jgi:hypothetical protein
LLWATTLSHLIWSTDAFRELYGTTYIRAKRPKTLNPTKATSQPS